MRKFSVVQVGVGGFGRGWLNALHRMREVKLVGLVDVSEAALARADEVAPFPKETKYASLDAALRELRPEVVVCVTPPGFHAEVCVKAVRAGAHAITEKPIADNMTRARRMVAEAAKAKRLLKVSQNYRYSPAVLTIKKAIQRAGLGPIGAVKIDFYRGPHFGGFREQMPYPLIIDMSIHHFDIVRFLLDANAEFVQGVSFNPRWSWFRGDAAACVIFEMSNGAVVSYNGSWCCTANPTEWGARYRIECERGVITAHGESVEIWRTGAAKPRRFAAVRQREKGGQVISMREFLRAISQGRQPDTSGADNLHSIAMVFKAVESFKKGGRQKVG